MQQSRQFFNQFPGVPVWSVCKVDVFFRIRFVIIKLHPFAAFIPFRIAVAVRADTAAENRRVAVA